MRPERILALAVERFRAHWRWVGCAAWRSVVTVIRWQVYRVINVIRIFIRVIGHRDTNINRSEWGVGGWATVGAKVKAIAVRIIAGKRLKWDDKKGNAQLIYDDLRLMAKIHMVPDRRDREERRPSTCPGSHRHGGLNTSSGV